MRSYGLGRLALVNQATRWLQLRSDRARRSDGLLQPAQSWEAQYAAGRWDFLAHLSELGRFSILAGYIGHLKPAGAVLDVGCGQGALLRRLPSACSSGYVGIDLSEAAINVARRQHDGRGDFLVADCEDYSPTEPFDVIVFNEVLCCLREPLRTVERYARSLHPGGLLLVSLCTATRGSATILRRLKRTYAVVDEVRVLHRGRNVSWACAALR